MELPISLAELFDPVEWNAESQLPNDLPDTSQIHLWRIGTRGNIDELGMLSRSELDRSEGMRDERRHQFLSARVALRKLLGFYLKRTAQSIHFSYGDSGKPRLDHPEIELEFNLSHVPDELVIAISHYQVGVDIESSRDLKDPVALAQRTFSSEDAALIEASDPDSRNRLFSRLWTCYEAAQKMAGQGIFGAVNRPESLWSLKLSDRLFVAVASEKEHDTSAIRCFSVDNLAQIPTN